MRVVGSASCLGLRLKVRRFKHWFRLSDCSVKDSSFQFRVQEEDRRQRCSLLGSGLKFWGSGFGEEAMPPSPRAMSNCQKSRGQKKDNLKHEAIHIWAYIFMHVHIHTCTDTSATFRSYIPLALLDAHRSWRSHF